MEKTLNTSLFAQVKGEVLFNSELSNGAYRFYCIILYLAGKNSHCWYTQIQLARLMGLKGAHADRSIRNYSSECESKGYMRVEQPGYHRPNKYYPLAKVIPQDKPVIHDESPPPPDRNPSPGLDRNQKPDKSHAPNNIQHDRAYRPLIGDKKKPQGGIDFKKYQPGGKYGGSNVVISG